MLVFVALSMQPAAQAPGVAGNMRASMLVFVALSMQHLRLFPRFLPLHASMLVFVALSMQLYNDVKWRPKVGALQCLFSLLSRCN